jgi:sulfoacetaldehyde dehydrogenase
MPRLNAPSAGSPHAVVAALVARARAAQRVFETWSQAQVDEAVIAAAWAIVEP